MDIFPRLEKEDVKENNLSIQAFGKRIVGDQSLYEYLLEFLLVFSSSKSKEDDSTKLSFHKLYGPDESLEHTYSYFIEHRIALKRFIFFENSKKEGQFKADNQLYEAMVKMVEDRIRDENATALREYIQELLYGYSIVLKNRSWFAQSLLPLSPVLLFGESMGEKKTRDKYIEIDEYSKIDRDFQFARHNFMARGGEVYYLHVLRSLNLYPEYKDDIEKGLRSLITQVEELSILGEFLQKAWNEEFDVKCEVKENKCRYIPLGYDDRAEYTCKELKNFLNSSMNVIDKIEILATGLVLQIIRMFHVQAAKRANLINKPLWVVDMKTGDKNIRTYSELSYRNYNENIIAALHVGINNLEFIKKRIKDKKTSIKVNIDNDEECIRQLMNKGADQSYKVMKKLGKEIKLIIPATGDHERFSVSEGLVKFLVLSLIEPGKKVTIEHFLDLLFDHFGMIIGRKHMQIYCENYKVEKSVPAYFNSNEIAFKQFLNNCGFLKDLSDATSIVFNPYDKEV